MTKTNVARGCVLLLALTGCAATSAASVASETPEAATEQVAVQQANDEFYAALNVMFTGDAAPMAAIWAHGDDVTYMGPGGGLRIGWSQVNAEWESQAAKKLGGKVSAGDVHITADPTLAVVVAVETGENRDAEGKPLAVSIRATNVFRKEQGTWKMIGHHTDLLPFLQP